ncbi:UNVERIFIED_CONTAM: hypothetical protein Slati_0197200 [Sesamum latifolium]|uniref:Uncharacterized protein n=1 Tax=Sesamum latifolium TaxID=2727402 RepID=A0AAW2YBJ6_9LAMI
MIGDGSSFWNSPSLLHTPTVPDKAYDDHIRDTVISRTNPGYNHRVHVTAMIPQVRGLLLLSEPGSQVIPTKPPKLPYDDPRESVHSG